MYRVIEKVFKCIAVKNKFLQTTYSQPPDLHINSALPSFDPDSDPWVVEIQLVFRDILTVKKELHKFYGIVRADTWKRSSIILLYRWGEGKDRR